MPLSQIRTVKVPSRWLQFARLGNRVTASLATAICLAKLQKDLKTVIEARNARVQKLDLGGRAIDGVREALRAMTLSALVIRIEFQCSTGWS